jgi:outer membrane protein insertion porin family/translocation and assembly module TamA
MDPRHFLPAGRFLGVVALVRVVTGCASIPNGRAAVNRVDLRGSKQLDSSDVTDKLATAPSPKFLGLFRGVVYDYELFSRATLQRDLARVERYYRARGYYDARATAGLVSYVDPKHVRVDIEVEEGPPVVNQPSRLEGLEGLPKDITTAVTRAASDALSPDAPFDEDKFEQAENDVRRALTDRGYAYAKVKRDALVDVVRHAATPVFTIAPDRPAKFGKVTIRGRTAESKDVTIEIPEEPMRRAIDIQEGEPYSTAAIEDATRALLDLEVFSSVEIRPELGDPPPESHVVPLTVSVEPNRLRQLRFGGGAEFDQLKTDVHGVAAWEDHNFLGGLRSFSVELKPGLVLFPTRIDHIVAPSRLLPEERLRLQLKQPGFIEPRTNLYVRPEFNVFPLLVRSDESAEAVLGYREVKGGIWLDRSYGKFYSSVGYNLQVENPFTYKGPLDKDLSTLVISYPEVTARLDFRDDRVHPHKGVYLATTFQFAGGPFGGRARDVKMQPEVRTYVPLASAVTFATRASVGFLYPRNYGDVVENHLGEDITQANRAERVRDIETVFFRGFYSGGPSSNRGYPTRGIAPHGVVPFLNPSTVSQQVATNCDPTNGFDANRCAIPIGGFTLWEFSNELRFQVMGPLSAAVFADMSDVSPKPSDIRLTHLHLSSGVGARYETPVGPVRLDIGYRIQPLQVLGFRNEDDVAKQDSLEGMPPKIFGAPLAIAFGIGEAY